MELTIHISDGTATALKERAAAVGEDLATYAAGIVERTTEEPRPLREISGPIADDFRRSGMTDDELGDFLEDVKHKLRREQGPVEP